jgi:hypothetical protein
MRSDATDVPATESGAGGSGAGGSDAGTPDTSPADVPTEASVEAGDGPALEAGSEVQQPPPDASVEASDGPTAEAGPDGGDTLADGGGDGASAPEAGADADVDASFSATIDVVATQNAVKLDSCAVNPAVFSNVPAGTYTIKLTASNLTKGGVSGPTPPPPSSDDYVIVYVPLPAGDPHESRRFFMLNGVDATASITLPATATIQMMFVDSDVADNAGTATVTLSPGGYSATVDAALNSIAYDSACHSTPASLYLPAGSYRATLVDSTLSSGTGLHDDFVLLRTPSEHPTDPFRYVILNGVGASQVISPFNSNTVRVWYIGASAGTGEAHVQVTRE